MIASERATFTQTISGTEIAVEFSRPSARGRTDLFGGEVHWGEVWTPGANMNTVLRVSKAVTVNGEPVDSGSYGVWIQVVEEGPWRFMLHPVDTLFHTVHPPLEEGILVVDMARTSDASFVETLRLDLQDLRATGARLEVAWGSERASVELGVDPGYVLTVAPEEARRYVGAWTLDETGSRPPDEMIEEIRSTVPPDEISAFEAWLETVSRPQPVEIVHEEDRLILRHPAQDRIMESMEGPGFQTVLMPLAEGIFEPGLLFRGELAGAGNRGIYEFEFDEAGRAVGFLIRDPSDALAGSGVRRADGS